MSSATATSNETRPPTFRAIAVDDRRSKPDSSGARKSKPSKTWLPRVRNRAQCVGLPTAPTATHREHREALAGAEARDDLARLLETDADLHREARGAEPAFVARQHGAHGGRDALG